MKSSKTLTLMLIGLAVSGVFAVAIVYACDGGGESGCQGHRNVAQMKDAKFEVKNTSNGVVIAVTSEKPEVAKAIQARFANFGKFREACGKDKCWEECKKAHEAGECKGHKGEGKRHEGKGERKGHELKKHGHAEGSKGCEKAHESGKQEK